MMPSEYRGEMKISCGYTITQPRTWTKQEHDWIYTLNSQGYSVEDIAKSTGRSTASITNKIRRLRKRKDVYNESHLDEKYEVNRMYAEKMNIKDMLDLYCGEKSFWKNSGLVKDVFANDKNKTFKADSHEKAEMLIHKLYYEGKHYDVIDIDPFGSGYDCFDLAIKMARKGIIITFGEMGHRRLNRFDFVSSHYGIENQTDFTIDNMVKVVQNIARQNKKELRIEFQREWNGIGRVWFSLHTLRITSQWKNSKNLFTKFNKENLEEQSE